MNLEWLKDQRVAIPMAVEFRKLTLENNSGNKNGKEWGFMGSMWSRGKEPLAMECKPFGLRKNRNPNL
jgi:hypothetical protein